MPALQGDGKGVINELRQAAAALHTAAAAGNASSILSSEGAGEKLILPAVPEGTGRDIGPWEPWLGEAAAVIDGHSAALSQMTCSRVEACAAQLPEAAAAAAGLEEAVRAPEPLPLIN